MTDVLIRRGKDIERNIHRIRDWSSALQAKKSQGSQATPEAKRKPQNRFFPRTLREYDPTD